MDISEIYELDTDKVAQQWFGTTSSNHTGVKRFFAAGDWAIGGSVTLVSPLASALKPYEISPTDSRYIFEHNGWSQVVGFHTRNVCHRAHEFLQNTALETANADGIYISPVTGTKKANDFLPEPVIRSYEMLLNAAPDEANTRMLGAFSTYSRFAGPREAIFTALCRKNMGCSHFIIGRDHTGVGDYYSPDANRRFFDGVGEIGVTPIFFDPIGYSPGKNTYELMDGTDDLETISGTQFREALLSGDRVPDWFVRGDVQDMLLAELAEGRPIFQA